MIDINDKMDVWAMHEDEFSVDDLAAEHGVFYCDGGCKTYADQVDGSYGIFGYLFTDTESKKGSGSRGPILATGTPVQQNTKDTVEVEVISYIELWGSYWQEATNNITELAGMIETAKLILKLNLKTALICTDSNYVLQSQTKYIKKWLTNGWMSSTGAPVANRELQMELHVLLNEIKDRGVKLKLEKVKAHITGPIIDVGNTKADYLANVGLFYCHSGENRIKGCAFDASTYLNILSPVGYWKTGGQLSRWFSKPYLYCMSNVDKDPAHADDGATVYYSGRHRDDDHVGKNVSDTSYSVLIQKEPVPALENLKGMIDAVSDDTMFYNVALSVVTDRTIYQKLDSGDVTFARHEKGTNYWETPCRRILFSRPNASLAFRSAEHLMELETILRRVCSDDRGVDDMYDITDVTELFYETDDTKKKPKVIFRKDILPTAKFMDIELDTRTSEVPVKTRLLYDVDLPTLNMMKGLANDSMKVMVVTIPFGAGFRYYTVISDDDHLSIWASVCSNIKTVGKKPRRKKK